MEILELLREFRGRLTKERAIAPGVYEETDDRLFGLAHYLVDEGFARWVKSVPDTAPVVTEEAEPLAVDVKPETVDLETVEELPPGQDFAFELKGRKVKGRKS